MKLSRFSKQIIAVVCAMALIVAGYAFKPSTAKAAAPSGWTQMATTGNVNLNNGWTYYCGGAGGTVPTAYYEENGSSLSLYVETAPTAEYGLQLWAPSTALTPGTSYQYQISFTADKAGTLNTKDDVSNSTWKAQSYVAGQNTLTGEFTAAAATRAFIANMTGVAADTTFTDITVTYSADYTTPAPPESTTDQDGYYKVESGWATPGSFQIFAGYGGRSMYYKGTGSYDDMKVKMAGSGSSEDWTTQIGINYPGLTSGTQYDFEVVFDSNEAFTMFAQVPGVTTINDIAVVNGENTVSGTFTAGTDPAHGQIMFFPKYAPDGTVFDFSSVTVTPHSAPTSTSETATPEPTTKAGKDCDQEAWTFAETDGWQYYVANADSTYEDGGSFDSGMTINYGSYLEHPGTCQARTPILTVEENENYTGSISVTCDKGIGAVTAAVWAYDSSTGEYTWLQDSEEGEQAVAADTKTTFTFDYNGPTTGKVVYLICTNYTPANSNLVFEATHSGEVPTTEAPTTTQEESTTEANHWVNVAGSNDYQYWDATDTNVVSYQNPGWSGEKEAGIYVLNPEGQGAPVKVVIDGVETSVAQGDNDTFYCMGAGLLFYDSTLVKPQTNIDIYYAPSTTVKHELKFKNINSPMYDVSEYKSTTPYTYPTKTDKLFAGWFSDAECTQPYMATTGYAFAKFIDADIVGPVKFQLATDNTAIRFLGALDSSDYSSAGFILGGTYGNNTFSNKSRAASKLYSRITAAGEEKTAAEVFHNDDAQYFFTYTLTGLDADIVTGNQMTWNATPYFVTLDGTTVTGETGNYPPSI